MKNQDVYLITSSMSKTLEVIELLISRGAVFSSPIGLLSDSGNIIKVIDGVAEVKDKSSTARGKILISISDIENYSW